MFCGNIQHQNPSEQSTSITKHCKNNIDLYHHENIKSQEDIIMEAFNAQLQ
jgi:hypothetical protein